MLHGDGAGHETPQQVCARLDKELSAAEPDEFREVVSEPYRYRRPEGGFFWLPIGKLGVAVPALHYRVNVGAALRYPADGSGATPSATLTLYASSIMVMVTPGTAHVRMGSLAGFDAGVTGIDVFRAGLGVSLRDYTCDPKHLERSEREAVGLLLADLYSPAGHGPGQAFADVGMAGSVLAVRYLGTQVSVRHTLVLPDSSWSVRYQVFQVDLADQVLSLAQLDRPGPPPDGAAPLPRDLALAGRALAGDSDAVRSWSDAHPSESKNLRPLLQGR